MPIDLELDVDALQALDGEEQPLLFHMPGCLFTCFVSCMFSCDVTMNN